VVVGIPGAHQAKHQVSVAADELGRALRAEVGAHAQRLLEQRRGERGVDSHLDRLIFQGGQQPVQLGDLH
jgi:hypothetical protein